MNISIHALREEGDRQTSRKGADHEHFYPRPPRGGRLGKVEKLAGDFRFLSTPSARRATGRRGIFARFGLDFYPRPPRGGRRVICFHSEPNILFLSTPSARRATNDSRGGPTTNVFLSTPSARRATPCGQCVVIVGVISIHALREEGDGHVGGLFALNNQFLSTPSARRATDHEARLTSQHKISIHALREEGDTGRP